MRSLTKPVLLCLLLAATAPARANLVSDPGFEICTANGQHPPDWIVDDSGGGAVICDSNPRSGSWDASFGKDTGDNSTLSQTFATTAGDNYDFSFWLGVDANPNAEFTASFGGDQVLDLVNPSDGPIALQDFTVTASGASTTIAFTGSLSGGIFALDDVSVTDEGPAPAPEPASLALLGSALGGLGWLRRRRRG